MESRDGAAAAAAARKARILARGNGGVEALRKVAGATIASGAPASADKAKSSDLDAILAAACDEFFAPTPAAAAPKASPPPAATVPKGGLYGNHRVAAAFVNGCDTPEAGQRPAATSTLASVAASPTTAAPQEPSASPVKSKPPEAVAVLPTSSLLSWIGSHLPSINPKTSALLFTGTVAACYVHYLMSSELPAVAPTPMPFGPWPDDEFFPHR